MESGLGPVKIENRVAFCTGEEFKIGDIGIKSFSIPHDAAEPVGYNFFVDGKRITTATDIGHIDDELLSQIDGNDLLLLESNHDVDMLKVGPYPWPLKKRIMGERGHLSNEVAAEVITYLAERGCKHFILGHLSHENNFPELAYQTTFNALSEKKIAVGCDVTLEVALRDRVGRMNIL
jgi:phosphoribosyl 1,2-cyclic phosphodiesterase